MKQSTKYLPWVSLGAGILGAVLYGLYLGQGTDSRGLYPAGHPALTALYCLMALVILGLALVLCRVKSPENTLLPRWICGMGHAAGGIGIAVCTVSLAGKALGLINVLALIFGVLATASLLFLGWLCYKGRHPHYLYCSIVTVFFILQLIATYQSCVTQPQVAVYLPQLLAMTFFMLSSYYRAADHAGIGSPRRLAFFNLGGIFFACIATASGQWPLFAGLALWGVTNNYASDRQPAVPPMELPEEVLYCLDVLTEAGHSAYVVGGCVRDHLLGKEPGDYDMCTSATPEETATLFSRHELVRNGEKHGTIGVIVAGQLYEITTFRKEGGYSDTRHPDWVEFVPQVTEDLARRDFTVNAMAYAPGEGLIDPFGGQQDLKDRILRAVGDPETRFREDSLRILRGVRFGVRFDLRTEEKTQAAMVSCTPLMAQLASERIFTEVKKLLPLITSRQLTEHQQVLMTVFPELSQKQFSRASGVMDFVPEDLALRLTVLLGGLKKSVAQQVLLRLKVPNALRQRVLTLHELAGTPLPQDKKLLRPLLGEYGEEVVLQALALQMAIARAENKNTDDMEITELLIATIGQDGSCLTVKDLAITGEDLLALGVEPGPQIGRCMQFLLRMVQEEILTNTREELLDAAKTFLS